MKQIILISIAIIFTSATTLPAAAEKFKPGDTFNDCGNCPEMVVLPLEEKDPQDDEGSDRLSEVSEHVAEVLGNALMKGPDHLFAVSVHEVTFSQWDYCVQQKRCSEHHPDDERGRGDMPVINVSPEDAQNYAKWLSQETDREYRYLLSEQLLPEHMLTKLTEVTKEYEDRATYFVYAGTDTKRAIAVGLLPPNKFGLRSIGFRVATTVPSKESAAEENKGLGADSTPQP